MWLVRQQLLWKANENILGPAHPCPPLGAQMVLNSMMGSGINYGVMVTVFLSVTAPLQEPKATRHVGGTHARFMWGGAGRWPCRQPWLSMGLPVGSYSFRGMHFGNGGIIALPAPHTVIEYQKDQWCGFFYSSFCCNLLLILHWFYVI